MTSLMSLIVPYIGSLWMLVCSVYDILCVCKIFCNLSTFTLTYTHTHMQALSCSPMHMLVRRAQLTYSPGHARSACTILNE